MKFLQYLCEMAIPSDNLKKNTYYHGTATEKAANLILQHGIEPQDLTGRKGKLVPVQNKIYLTPDLKYAVIYCVGGLSYDKAYSKQFIDHLVKSKGQYGCLFVVNGSTLQDIQPDEDCIGEMIYDGNINWLTNFAKRNLTPAQYKRVMKYDDYADFAVAGKKLVKLMTDKQKLDLIVAGTHIAHEGKIIPNECWKFNKYDSEHLIGDCSNFFKLAKRVK